MGVKLTVDDGYDDRWIDELLFGTKRCTECGEDLPANTEHFTVDLSAEDKLTARCRNCRRTDQRARDVSRRARRKAERARRREGS